MKFNDIWKPIRDGMKTSLLARWAEVQSFSESESKKIAHSLMTISELYLLPAGDPEKITKEQARLLLDIQVSASRGILLTVEALGLIAVQQALEAGLGAVKTAVNTEIGFPLL